VKRGSQDRAFSADIRALAPQLIFIALVLGLPSGIALSASVFRDGDTSWQIAAGEWILQHGRIPSTDPFSFTAAGRPWVAMEWLSQVILGSAFRLAGYAGLATIVAAALIGLQAIIFFHLQQRVSILVLASTLIMMDLALAPFVLARPHMLAWPLLAGWTVLLLRAADTGRAPPTWSALILMVWTNLHASFPLAIMIAGAIGLDALIKARGTTLRQWLVFGAASLIAVSFNANGVDGLLQPFKTSTLGILPLIGEWHASSPHATPFFFAALVVGIGAMFWSGIAVPMGRLLLLSALLAMALVHVRHQSSFIIVGACIVPPLCASKPGAVAVPRWLLAGALPLLAYLAIAPLTPPESQANPRGLIGAIPADLRTQPVFNSYIFGGPLILAGIRPYIDGRAEIYGDEFVADYVNMTDGDMRAFNRAVQRYDIRWAMISKSHEKLIRAVESSGAWRRVYSDDVGVIDVRTAVSASR
jgi:hypothetical protein